MIINVPRNYDSPPKKPPTGYRFLEDGEEADSTTFYWTWVEGKLEPYQSSFGDNFQGRSWVKPDYDGIIL